MGYEWRWTIHPDGLTQKEFTKDEQVTHRTDFRDGL